MPVNRKLARENYDRWAYIRDNGHSDFVTKADVCENYFAGQQWEAHIKARLERQGKPALTINKTLSTLATVFGNHLEAGADVTFRPFKDGSAETADALSKVYLHISNANKLQFLEPEVAADGFITSRGFFDVRMDFTDGLQGDVRITVPNPKNVGIDPDAETYDPATWKDVTITKWLTPNDIEVMYDAKKDADYLASKATSDFLHGYDSIERDVIGGHRGDPENPANQDPRHRRIRVIERQHKKMRRVNHFLDTETGEMRPVPDNWSEEKVQRVLDTYGFVLYPRVVEQIRWTVSADDVILHDEWSPYKFFTIVPFFPYFRRGTTIGMVEVEISPQDLLNKSMSQFLHIINTSANSGWKVRSGSLQNMDPEELESRGAETGLVLELDDIGAAEKIQPNQVPTGHDRVVYLADEFMKDVTGVSDSMRGMDRADVAAKAINAKQMAGSANLAKPFHNLAWTRHLLAERILNLVQTYYTEERTLQITGSTLRAETENIVVNQATPEGEIVNDLTLGEYEVVVTPAPARQSMEEGVFQEALGMRREGIAIPDHYIVEASSMRNKKEIAEEMRAAAGAGGEPTEVEMQMQQMEAQLKQIEMAEKQAEAELKTANAQLAQARAQSTLAEMQRPEQPEQDNGQATELLRLKMDAQFRAEELKMKREQMQAEIQLKREKMQMDAQMARRQQAQQALQAEQKQAAAGGEQ